MTTYHPESTTRSDLPVAALPVAVIGAGPVGLAATAHLSQRGIPSLLLERSNTVGAHVREWGHVRLFSPWRYVMDPVSRELLTAHGWTAPEPDTFPTGHDLVERYLEPLAAIPDVARRLHLGHRVVHVGRLGIDKTRDAGRNSAPFVVVAEGPAGTVRFEARAIIDASGTWSQPNPLGAEGFEAIGESAHADQIHRGIPDILGADRQRYAGRRVAVVGSGHSAQNAILDLAGLSEPPAAIHWVVRRDGAGQMFGGGTDDQLPARGALGDRARRLIDGGTVDFVTGFHVGRVEDAPHGIQLVAQDGRHLGPLDAVIAATGQRPDLEFLRELRLDLDPSLECSRALGPMIDPNLHSCGTVPPHGAEELAHPEPDVYVVGHKSYGRAPTFLLLTGYEQVRSVVAALVGDHAAAAAVELTLPETGVCCTDRPQADTVTSCC